MADIFSKEKRSEIMSKIHGEDTKIELLVRKWLFSHGYRYRINDRRYPGTPDIVLPKYKTVIFIHGCFWHAHESCRNFKIPKTRTDFWKQKLQSNKERDNLKTNSLEEMGWKVVIIWECELESNPHERLKRLLNEIKMVF